MEVQSSPYNGLTIPAPSKSEGTDSCLKNAVRWFRKEGSCSVFRKTMAIALAIFLSLTIIGIPIVILAAREWKKLSIKAPENIGEKQDISQASLQKINEIYKKLELSIQELNKFLDEKEPLIKNAPDLNSLSKVQLDEMINTIKENLNKRTELLNETDFNLTAYSLELDCLKKSMPLKDADKVNVSLNDLQLRLDAQKAKFVPLKEKAENQSKVEKARIDETFEIDEQRINENFQLQQQVGEQERRAIVNRTLEELGQIVDNNHLRQKLLNLQKEFDEKVHNKRKEMIDRCKGSDDLATNKVYIQEFKVWKAEEDKRFEEKCNEITLRYQNQP